MNRGERDLVHHSGWRTGKIIVSRLREGDDLIISLKKHAEANGVKTGVFFLIGTLKKAVLGYYNDGKYDTIHFKGPLEIASCTGNITVNEEGEAAIHAHIVISNEKCEAFGGHLMEGSEVGATAELVITEVKGAEILRMHDKKTNLKLLRLS